MVSFVFLRHPAFNNRSKQEKVTTSVPNKPKMDFKIATLNLCLGLNSKKNLTNQTRSL